MFANPMDTFVQSVTANDVPKDGRTYTEVNKSLQDKVEQWYLKPLERMSKHDAFVCLSICFLLYEKYLRATKKIGADEAFSQGHSVFKKIGKTFNMPADDAFYFWNYWRNGLLHRAMPKEGKSRTYCMTPHQEKSVVVTGDSFSLNPWLFRDEIVKLIRANRAIWKDEDFPFAREFKLAP
jgi:hypothetical protein